MILTARIRERKAGFSGEVVGLSVEIRDDEGRAWIDHLDTTDPQEAEAAIRENYSDRYFVQIR